MPLASDSVAKKPDSPFFFLVASRLKYASLMEPRGRPPGPWRHRCASQPRGGRESRR